MTIPAQTEIQMMRASQNLRKIFGTSIQKLDASTSFLVAPQVMLYEKTWARRAWEMWMLSPPKKKKLQRGVRMGYEQGVKTEYAQERDPTDVFNERLQKIFVSEAVFEERESDITGTWEDNSACQPNLKTLLIEPIHFEPPAEEKVVQDG